jgi:hypothetical protein
LGGTGGIVKHQEITKPALAANELADDSQRDGDFQSGEDRWQSASRRGLGVCAFFLPELCFLAQPI